MRMAEKRINSLETREILKWRMMMTEKKMALLELTSSPAFPLHRDAMADPSRVHLFRAPPEYDQ